MSEPGESGTLLGMGGANRADVSEGIDQFGAPLCLFGDVNVQAGVVGGFQQTSRAPAWCMRKSEDLLEA